MDGRGLSGAGDRDKRAREECGMRYWVMVEGEGAVAWFETGHDVEAARFTLGLRQRGVKARLEYRWTMPRATGAGRLPLAA